MNYEQFLMQKMKEKKYEGFQVNVNTLNAKMTDWQKAVTSWSLSKGRAALFEDCGLGKTFQQLVWGQKVYEHTNRNILILAPLAVSQQTVREGEKFDIDVNICRSQDDVRPGVNITNYELLDRFNPDLFSGIILDESSILKSYMGKTKMKILKAFEQSKYKLSCTATPSPNNHLEILNQAEFLGVLKACEALAIWFINDTKNAGNYRLKKHAIKAFWEWVSTWAICMSSPSDIGFSDDGYILPPLNEMTEVVDVSIFDKTFEDGMFRKVETSATGYLREKRLTADKRAKRSAEIAESIDGQVVIWCELNNEADLLKKYIPDAIEIRGSDKPEQKEDAAMSFINGDFKILISKPDIFGYGLNFQNCHNTIFCGRDYSYEKYYQATRRFWRFGQTNPVNVWSVIGSTEKNILNVVAHKAELQTEMKTNMYSGLKQIQSATIKGTEFKLNLEVPQISVPNWLKGAS